MEDKNDASLQQPNELEKKSGNGSSDSTGPTSPSAKDASNEGSSEPIPTNSSSSAEGGVYPVPLKPELVPLQERLNHLTSDGFDAYRIAAGLEEPKEHAEAKLPPSVARAPIVKMGTISAEEIEEAVAYDKAHPTQEEQERAKVPSLEEHRDVKQQRELNELNPHLAAPPSLPHQEPKKAVPGGPHQPSLDEDKHDSLGHVKDDAGPVGPRGAHVSPEHLSEEQKAESARQQHEREHRGMSSTAAVDSRGESKHIFVHEPQGNDRNGARIPDKKTDQLVEEAPPHVGPRGIGVPKDTFHRG